MTNIKGDFIKLYNKILEEYKDAFAIYFNKNDFPHQRQFMYRGKCKDELFTDFYIIINNNEFEKTYFDLLECAYYQYGDYDYGRFDYFTVSYEILQTHKNISLEHIIETIPRDYLEMIDLDGREDEWIINDENGKIIDSSDEYILINGIFYKINEFLIASDENKKLLISYIAKS